MQANKSTEPIPGYSLKKRIGSGGYGEVWLADAPGGLTKALKFVYGYLDEERGAREMKAMNRIKQVRHPFLLSLERIEVVDGQLVIVTELADGSLKDVFAAHAKAGKEGIPRAELLVYLRDAADALDYMSEQFSLQHLDVKPENLLMVGQRVKVADFGLVKDIQDVAASMTGGLTPLYAPPELFDGRPCLQSDQYSLAIVYQEMLTGVLPFPGTTAAQLATQHLHSKPRLLALPDADQQIIARALSKDPAKRFSSCVEMVEHLCRPPTIEVHSAPAPTSQSPQQPAPTSAADVVTETKRPLRNSRVPEIKLPPANPSPVVKKGAPVALDPSEVKLYPTLFVGIGGTAGLVFRQLQRRLRDRFGGASALPALRMVLVDTDSKALMQMSHGEDGLTLDPQALVATPLRRPQDYRNNAKQLTKSISRRWLYNIPKSQQTEGLRPLGRLALADHSSAVLAKLEHDLREIMDSRGIATSQESTGIEFTRQRPRVVVVSSISGGTGSGMTLDVAFMIRKVLDDLNLPADEIHGVLAHSTGRNPATNELAIVNAYTFLSELQHYSSPQHCYPADPGCHLPNFDCEKSPFESTHLVHMGDELNDQQFASQIDRLAAYLYLSSTTSASSLLECCRQADNPTPGSAATTIRSFGLTQVGAFQEHILSTTVETLCNHVIRMWLGEPTKEGRSASISGSRTSTSRNSETSAFLQTFDDVDKRALRRCGELGLNVETLGAHIHQLLGDCVGAEVTQELQPLLQQDRTAADAVPWQGLLQTIDRMLGVVDDDDQPRNAPITALPPEVIKQIDDQFEDVSQSAVDWIIKLVDQSERHFAASRHAANWFDQYLTSLRDQTVEAERNLDAEIGEISRSLAAVDAAQAARKNRRKVQEPKTAMPPGDLVLQYLQLRIGKLSLNGVRRLVLGLQSRVKIAAENLSDGHRELARLASTFDAMPHSMSASHARDGEADVESALNLRILEKLGGRLTGLIAQLESDLCHDFLEQHGGLKELLLGESRQPAQVVNNLRNAARKLALASHQQEDIVALMLGAEASPEQAVRTLEGCLQASEPHLMDCGGTKRLLMIVPESSSHGLLKKVIEGGMEEKISISFNNVCDLVFCYEAGNISIAQIAARLIDDRIDYAQAASRLHTRSDVPWSPWES